jgi:hypothetical protein
MDTDPDHTSLKVLLPVRSLNSCDLTSHNPLRVPIRPAPPRRGSSSNHCRCGTLSATEGPDGSGVNGLTPADLRPVGCSTRCTVNRGLPQSSTRFPLPPFTHALNRARILELWKEGNLMSTGTLMNNVKSSLKPMRAS